MFVPRPGPFGRRHHRGPRRDILFHVGQGLFNEPVPGPDDLPFMFRELSGRHARRPFLRRGGVRPLILALLARKAMHGYEIIQSLEEQSGGRWRPSAGSIYPTLQQLADEGLVTSDEVDGRRTYALTDTGRAAAADAPTPPAWDEMGEANPNLRTLGVQLLQAVIQVQRAGSPHAKREVNRLLDDTRRQIYRLLADDDHTAAADGDESSA